MKKKPFLFLLVSLLLVFVLVNLLTQKKEEVVELTVPQEQLPYYQTQKFVLEDSPPEAPSLQPKFPEFNFGLQKPLLVEETSTPGQVDILVVYSSGARQQVGSVSEMEAQVSSLIADANQSFYNSEVEIHFRLVGVSEVSYQEVAGATAYSLWYTALEDLRNGNGVLAQVHELREERGADIVSMIIYDPLNAFCGLGYIMSPSFIGYGFRDWAVSITSVADSCTDKWSMVHEMGHNMGGDHDPENSSGDNGSYSYSHGHRVLNSFRTMMSYGNNYTYPRQLLWSNPNKSFNGIPTGITGERNNALTLNQNTSIVASWRSEQVAASQEVIVQTSSFSAVSPQVTGLTMVPEAVVEVSTDGTHWNQAETLQKVWTANVIPSQEGSQEVFIRVNKGVPHSFVLTVQETEKIYLPIIFK